MWIFVRELCGRAPDQIRMWEPSYRLLENGMAACEQLRSREWCKWSRCVALLIEVFSKAALPAPLVIITVYTFSVWLSCIAFATVVMIYVKFVRVVWESPRPHSDFRTKFKLLRNGMSALEQLRNFSTCCHVTGSPPLFRSCIVVCFLALVPPILIFLVGMITVLISLERAV